MSKIENENFDGIYNIISESSSFLVDSTYDGVIVSANPGGGAIIITLPPDLPQGFSFEVMQVGPGTVDFSADIGATIYNAETTINSQYTRIRIINSIFVSNEWLLEGDLV